MCACVSVYVCVQRPARSPCGSCTLRIVKEKLAFYAEVGISLGSSACARPGARMVSFIAS